MSFHTNHLTTTRSFRRYTSALTGWRYGFWNGDHYIREITTRLYDVQYKPDVGEISWRFQLELSDRNFDDDFFARYNWLVIACSDCAMLQGTVSDIADWHELFGPVGYEQGVLLPQSWYLEIQEGWMHDKELQTIWGRLNWNFLPADKTFLANLEGELQGDDPNYGTRKARADVVGIFFDKGAVTSYETGTMNSTGDWEEKGYRLNLPEPFWSWAW